MISLEVYKEFFNRTIIHNFDNDDSILLFEDFKLFSTFSGINLLIGVSNLIPVKSFDGGTMLSCFLASHINEEVAHKVLTVSTILIVAITAAISVYFKSLFVGVIALFLFMYSLAWKDEGT